MGLRFENFGIDTFDIRLPDGYSPSDGDLEIQGIQGGSSTQRLKSTDGSGARYNWNGNVLSQAYKSLVIPANRWRRASVGNCIGVRSTAVNDRRVEVTSVTALPIKVRHKQSGSLLDFLLCIEDLNRQTRISVAVDNGRYSHAIRNVSAFTIQGTAYQLLTNWNHGDMTWKYGDLAVSQSNFEFPGQEVILSFPSDQPFEFVPYPS